MAKWRYGIVIDAGSSGSRIHIYKWPKAEYAKLHTENKDYESLPVLKTHDKWTLKKRPGISDYGSDPDSVGPDYLDELLNHAKNIVPLEQASETPIFLLATAGVRLLSGLEQTALLQNICSYTRANTNFLLPDCDLHIQTIPGETEGLYGWIAANYLLGGFDSPRNHDHGKEHHTYGFLDMGGASAQIAFVPNSTETKIHADDLKLLRLRKVNGAVDEYRVFVTTWLGLGVHEARASYVDALLKELGTDGELPDPCLPNGLRSTIDGHLLGSKDIKEHSRYLLGTGKFKECLKRSYPLLGKDAECENTPCLLNGVHSPTIDFDINHFVGISEYWHTTHEIFGMGHKDKPYDFVTYQNRVEEFCSQGWDNILESLKANKWGDKINEDTAMEVCFKANWIINVLHDGIGIPRLSHSHRNGHGHNITTKLSRPDGKERGFTDSFQAVHKIGKQEVSWTLGKMLLYAASEIPPNKASSLPVGFGTNAEGVPEDFQYPAAPVHINITVNGTQSSIESWRDRLFEGKSPRRVPGFVLFLIIIIIAIFLLCGKERRSRFYVKVFSRLAGSGSRISRRKGGGLFAPKIAVNGANERLLESGICDPDDFELAGLNSDEEYSDDSAGKTGKTSGWATPRPRALHDVSNEDYLTAGGSIAPGFGLGINAMERSGLFPRTESRESLHGMERGRKSRRTSPTRHKSPLMSSVAED